MIGYFIGKEHYPYRLDSAGIIFKITHCFFVLSFHSYKKFLIRNNLENFTLNNMHNFPQITYPGSAKFKAKPRSDETITTILLFHKIVILA